jgi:hypothetical protein
MAWSAPATGSDGSTKLTPKQRNINPDHPKCRGVSSILRRANGPQLSEARMESASTGEVSGEPDGVTPLHCTCVQRRCSQRKERYVEASLRLRSGQAVKQILPTHLSPLAPGQRAEALGNARDTQTWGG